MATELQKRRQARWLAATLPPNRQTTKPYQQRPPTWSHPRTRPRTSRPLRKRWLASRLFLSRWKSKCPPSPPPPVWSICRCGNRLKPRRIGDPPRPSVRQCAKQRRDALVARHDPVSVGRASEGCPQAIGRARVHPRRPHIRGDIDSAAPWDPPIAGPGWNVGLKRGD